MVETKSHNGGSKLSSVALKSTKEDVSAINAKLYLLLQTTNIEINYEVFCLLLNLLRKGCTPEAIYMLISRLTDHSLIFKRLKKLQKKTKTGI